ncbi:Fe-S cluster assembly transcriptional regulator IscR [Cocleimonas flava]|uniref:BadM/Rrf2 family transcriptional regulator n=1 Tax=Cocleimonas flava TaxID=634765 RepID=A0A4R1EYD5_9GAMM|nr:Rrf2 family transcriptional regulator [Cocleimonas flava]TCJ83031.1 BadM/Rrf2 family transcriptional regulator [Cocleimonas flava]
MKISTKGQYAVKAMINLAINFNNPVSLVELSNSQAISVSYLEQLFSVLRRAELVQGVRGPGGGYRLGRAPDQISVADIITAIEESANNANLKKHLNARQGQNILANNLWNGFSAQLTDYLGSISLADILKDEIVVKGQYQLDETTRRISTMFPVSAKMIAA